MSKWQDKNPPMPTEEQRFTAALGSLFPCLSDNAVRKCWREIRDYDDERRAIMLDAMLSYAILKADAKGKKK
jgi:hypothetical protein